MSGAAKEILAQINALPEEEQDWLTDQLVERRHGGHDGELSDAWKQEIVRRMEQLRSGEVQVVPGAEVEARIRASLERVRKARSTD